MPDPKYGPPYPQNFYRFWPRHALLSLAVVVAVFLLILVLARAFPLPTDPNMPPLPDDGAGIPAPEWYLFFVFQPFWYLTGEWGSLLPLGTFWLPLFLFMAVLTFPFFFGREKTAPGMGFKAKAMLAVSLLGIWGLGLSLVVVSGAPAKTRGCPSCHNAMMGVRQSLPPADMGLFYRQERQSQIEVGQYRIGDTGGAAASYKDANWQLRHFYEPTMTW